MSGSPRSVGIRLLLRTLLSGVGLVVSATAASVYVAGDPQRRHSLADGPGAGAPGTGIAFTTASHASGSLTALIDSLMQPLARIEAADSAVNAQLVTLLTSPEHRGTFVTMQASDHEAARGSALAVFRMWAHVERTPMFWQYRAGFPSVADIRTLPVLRLPAIDSLFSANEQAADSALVRGDVDTALLRARENVAAARHLLGQPLAYDAVIGRARLHDAAALLARTARQADQPTLHSAAQRLQRLTQSARPAFPTPWSRQSPRAADPDDPRLQQLASDRAAFPASRLAALDQLVLGSCVSTREMLFGISAARHAAVDRLSEAMRDIPRVEELRPLYHRALDAFDHAEPAAASPSAHPLRLLVPNVVSARVDYCRALQP